MTLKLMNIIIYQLLIPSAGCDGFVIIIIIFTAVEAKTSPS